MSRPIGTCTLSGAPLYEAENVVLVPLAPSGLCARRIPEFPEFMGTIWLGDNAFSTGLFQPLTLPLFGVARSERDVFAPFTPAPNVHTKFLSRRLGDVGSFAADVIFGSAHAGVMRFSPRRIRGAWRGHLYGALFSREAWNRVPRNVGLAEHHVGLAEQVAREGKEYRMALGEDRRTRRDGEAGHRLDFDLVSSSAPEAFALAHRQIVQSHVRRFMQRGTSAARTDADAAETAAHEDALRAAMPPGGFEQTYQSTDEVRKLTWTVTLHINPDDLHMRSPVGMGVTRDRARPRAPTASLSRGLSHAEFGRDTWDALRETGWRPNPRRWERRFDVGPMTSRMCSPEMRRIYRGALFREFAEEYQNLVARLDAMTLMGRLMMPAPVRCEMTEQARAVVRSLHMHAARKVSRW